MTTHPPDNGRQPSEGVEQTVADDEGKSQNATIARIQQFRDTIADYQVLFAENELAADVSAADQHRSYHQLAKGFLQLLKPYLTDENIDGSKHYWERIELGSFSVDPPPAISPPSREEAARALRGRDTAVVARADPRNEADPHEYDVIGLQDFAAAPPEWDVRWSLMYGPEVSVRELRARIETPGVRVLPRQHRAEPITVVRTARVPLEIINDAITAMENFVRALGMDIELEAEPYEGGDEPGL